MRLYVTKLVSCNKDVNFELVVPDGTPEDEIKKLVEGALAAREAGKPFAAENVIEYGLEDDSTTFRVSQLDAEDNDIEDTEIEWDI
jgi:hypothetical protein